MIGVSWFELVALFDITRQQGFVLLVLFLALVIWGFLQEWRNRNK